jgi:hypothetical protein
MVPFLAITCHFVRRDTEYKHEAFLLNFEHLPGSHDAESQAQSIKNCAEDYGIQHSIRCITADNAAVNLKSMVELEQLLPEFSRKDCSIGCMAHALNLSAQKILKELKADIDPINESETRLNADETVENAADRQNDGNSEDSEAAVAAIFRVARKIVVKVRNSHLLEEALSRQCCAQNMPSVNLILDVKTRWNSTYAMLRRLLRLRRPLDIVCRSEVKLSGLNLTFDDHDWSWIEKLCQVLSLFVEATEDLSGETYPTLWKEYAHYSLLSAELTRWIEDLDTSSETLRNACIEGWNVLNRYWNKADLSSAPAIATILDPRCKLNAFHRMGWKQTWIDRARNDFYRVAEDEWELQRSVAESPAPLRGGSADRQPAVLSQVQRTLFETAPEPISAPNRAPRTSQEELDAYLASGVVTLPAEVQLLLIYCYYTNYLQEAAAFNQLRWWDDHKFEYPLLSVMAFDYAAIPATSVPSERVFSRAGDLITKKRNRLSPKTAQCIMCFRAWMGIKEVSVVDREEEGPSLPEAENLRNETLSSLSDIVAHERQFVVEEAQREREREREREQERARAREQEREREQQQPRQRGRGRGGRGRAGRKRGTR